MNAFIHKYLFIGIIGSLLFFQTGIACNFTSAEDLILTPSGTHNSAAGYTQVYLIADEAGNILGVSSSGNFGPQAYGKYFAYALNYETASPPSSLPAIGVNVSALTGGCSNLYAAPTPVTVCDASVLEACENSGEVIKIVSTPDYNMDAGFNQIIVIVNDATGNIQVIKSLSATGAAIFTTETATGELTNGSYTAYAVNYEDPETPTSMGLIVGNPWTGTFGSACAAASAGASIIVHAPGACSGTTSTLTACENSGDVISVHVAGYNSGAGFSQAIVIVDSASKNIVAVKDVSSGMAIFTTETATGDLGFGIYKAYALNFENPATLTSLGAVIGNPWPITFGGACADTSDDVRAVVTSPETCVLPVEIVRFDGTGHQEYNLLNWEVVSPAGAIALEHHHPASGNVSVLGMGLDPLANHYHYAPPSGSNFYRLKITEPNGEVNYTHFVELENTSAIGFDIVNNPVNDRPVELIWRGDAFEFAQVRIVDMLGRILLSKGIYPEGKEKAQIATAGSLAQGIYLIDVLADGKKLPAQRLIIE